MADQSFILFARPGGWRVAAWPTSTDPLVEIESSAHATPADTADAIRISLRAAGYSGNAVAVCVPSAWCLSASISMADIPRGDTKAMLYRFEESLPLAAEAVVADFVVRRDSALGVCARIDAIAQIISALEAAGISVQSIIPTALATAQGSVQSGSTCVLLYTEPGAHDAQLVNVIVLQDGLPTHWALVPATALDVKLQLDLLSTELGSIPHIQGIDIDADLASQLVETTSHVIDLVQNADTLPAARFAAEVLRGRSKPWVELRRDQLAIADPLRLHRRWINSALAAAIALFLSLALVFLIRAHRYHQVDRTSSSETLAAFKQHFPGWEAPINVRAVVDAQYRRAAGAGNSPALADQQGSALVTLHDVLLGIMTQQHVQVSRMAFHENSFEISGRLQSYEQLDVLSKLAGANGMFVTPAQTRKDTDGTWTFVLQGSKPPETSSN